MSLSIGTMKNALQQLFTSPLLISVLLPALAHSEVPVQAWVQRYNGSGNGDDWATAVVVDSSNNVIVTGYSTGSGSGYDYATIKYSSAGVPLWTNRYNGPANNYDRANAAAVDGNDDVIVTGSSFGGRYDDYLTIKYTSAGVPLWTNRYSGNGTSVSTSVAVDANNDVLVTGFAWGTYADYVTIKYSSDGVPLWTNRYNGPGSGNDYARAVAVDGSNNVIVAGGPAYATIKYSSAGQPLWTNRYARTGSSDDQAYALAVDGSNNVIVTGCSWSMNTDDYATIKYSSDGQPLWTNRYRMPIGNNYDYAQAVAVDGSNDVIVTGYSYGSDHGYHYATIKYSSAGSPLWTNRYNGWTNDNGPGNPADLATAVVTDASNNIIVTGYSTNYYTAYDYATIKYSSTGVPLWTNRYNGPWNGPDSAYSVAVDRNGNVIVTGASYGIGSGSDFATIKYICVPEPQLTGLQPTNSPFQLRVDGVLQPGTLVIEASTDLAGWSPVFTNTTPTNVLYYTDPDAGGHPSRLYRAFQFP
jgi:uncharacterized delta-60 repeat protein